MMESLQVALRSVHASVLLDRASYRSTLQITTMSVQHMATYRTAVDNTAEAFENSIGKMTDFVKRCSQLATNLKSVDDIYVKVREIKRVLDQLEKVAGQMDVLQVKK